MFIAYAKLIINKYIHKYILANKNLLNNTLDYPYKKNIIIKKPWIHENLEQFLDTICCSNVFI